MFHFIILVLVHFLLVDSSSENDVAIAASINEYSIDMYKEIAKSVDGNIIYSPFSIYNAFAMVGVGAKSDTMKQMSKVFHWRDFDKLLQNTKALYKHMMERKTNESYLAIANKIWVADDIRLLASYIDELRETFLVTPETESFGKNPDIIRQNINDWIANKTNDKIKDLFPPTSITEMTKMVLANAIYFEGVWEEQFDVKDTKEEPFYLANGNTIQVDYMTREDDYLFYKDETRGVELLSIPYTGKKFSMLFVKPVKATLNTVESATTSQVISEWVNALNSIRFPADIRVSIPKFELRQTLEGLKELMMNMGVKDLFLADKADLSGITGSKDLFCSAAIHKAFIKVDEKGTTAAAATGLGVSLTSLLPTPTFTLDRPFLFYIVDRRYNATIFAGRVMNPGKPESKISAENIKFQRDTDNSAYACVTSSVTFFFTIMISLFLW